LQTLAVRPLLFGGDGDYSPLPKILQFPRDSLQRARPLLSATIYDTSAWAESRI